MVYHIQGEEACLDGLSFVLTGVLEYFDKGELKTHIESLGGAVRTSVSKKTSYLVIGREPGDSKTQKVCQTSSCVNMVKAGRTPHD